MLWISSREGNWSRVRFLYSACLKAGIGQSKETYVRSLKSWSVCKSVSSSPNRKSKGGRSYQVIWWAESSRGKCLSIAGNLPGIKTSKRSGAKTFGNLAFHQVRKFTYISRASQTIPKTPKKQDGAYLEQAKDTGNALQCLDVGRTRTYAPEGNWFLVNRINHFATTPLMEMCPAKIIIFLDRIGSSRFHRCLLACRSKRIHELYPKVIKNDDRSLDR